MSSTDRIEKRVTLRAPASRVWRAIADTQEFGCWFGFRLEGAFVEGKTIRGTFDGLSTKPRSSTTRKASVSGRRR